MEFQGSSEDLTAMLRDWQNPDTQERLIHCVYSDLRRIAHSCFQKHSGHHTLQPTALIHEVYIHLLNHPNLEFENRRHFFNTATLIMRQLLSKYARGKKVLKRGGDRRLVTFDEGFSTTDLLDPVRAMAVEDALAKLEKLDARKAHVVQLRVFLGLSVEEIARVLETTDRTVRRDWQFIRVWFGREMERGSRVSSE